MTYRVSIIKARNTDKDIGLAYLAELGADVFP
jgi:hypothetical protein